MTARRCLTQGCCFKSLEKLSMKPMCLAIRFKDTSWNRFVFEICKDPTWLYQQDSSTAGTPYNRTACAEFFKRTWFCHSNFNMSQFGQTKEQSDGIILPRFLRVWFSLSDVQFWDLSHVLMSQRDLPKIFCHRFFVLLNFYCLVDCNHVTLAASGSRFQPSIQPGCMSDVRWSCSAWSWRKLLEGQGEINLLDN